MNRFFTQDDVDTEAAREEAIYRQLQAEKKGEADEEDEEPAPRRKTDAIVDVAGLTAAMQSLRKYHSEFEKGKEFGHWLHYLDVSTERHGFTEDVGKIKDKDAKRVNFEDEFDREIVLSEQARQSVIAARKKLDEKDVPHRRPDDYMAEMAKSDGHMARIKRKVVAENERINNAEKARVLRDQKAGKKRKAKKGKKTFKRARK